ncbi:hypothetical protein [Paenibacillus hunanensis]|uniref:Uncharacterized protein n=1 Tax=Paenibacillus hunanensis TaxID=539262 RepID=A0ABU1IUL2_9BACL|nr:hypothetical protein [Paenibacillus hunanensis]MDR6242958.1 hypothetical protein [Paenibacillus hunanensis]GGJ13076.1 hypothetical protein GCM10008022_22720 [Paenibacillus hunanensis]
MTDETTYDELMEWFTMRREIEFLYKGVSYAFLSVKGGFMLVRENRIVTDVYVDYMVLAHEVAIDGVLFLELFKKQEIEITMVF